MATLNVLLKASAKDKGVRKFFRDATKDADKFTTSVERAARAGRALEGLSMPAAATGGRARGGGGGGPRPRAERGGRRGRDPIEASLRQIAKDRARTAKRQNREAESVVKQQIAAGKTEARILHQQARERQRQSRQIKNLSQEQLEAVELEREINNRRRRAARAQAREKLGPDKTPRAGGAFRRFEQAENLAVAAGEFEQVADTIDRGVRASRQSFIDFEKGVVEVSTLTKDIDISEIEKITKGAAAEFGGLPTDQVKAFYQIVSAGATTGAAAQEQLNAANQLAIAGAASQEGSVLAISKAVANFGSQGVTATKASDSLFAAVQKGQTTVEGMARALPIVAQAASTAGFSIDETNAAIAVLSKRFPTAAEGSSALRQALSNIAKPSKAAREEAKKLGIDFSTAGIQAAGGIEEFLLKLRASEKFDENTLAKLFKSTEARAAIGGLIDGMDEFNETIQFVENSSGSAGKAFAEMAETSAQKAARLEAKMELLKIEAGEALIPALEGIAEVGGPVIEWLTKATSENPRTAKTVAALAIGVLVLTRAVSGLASGMSIWNTLSGIAATKTTAVTAATTKGAASATAYGNATKSASKGLGLVPGVALAATVAIVAFNYALDQAEKPLAKFEQKITDVATEQQKISFGPKREDIDRVDQLKKKLAELDEEEEKMGRKGRRRRKRKRKELEEELAAANKAVVAAERPREELERERLNRQIEIVNAARQAEAESMGAGAGAALAGGDITGGIGLIAGGALGRATGVSDELTRQREREERALARLAEEQAGAGVLSAQEAAAFQAPEQGLAATLGALQELVDATNQVAANTSAPATGPSMEAGLV